RYEFFLDRDNSWNDCVSAMQVFNYMHAVRRNPDAPPLSNKEKTCERTENEYKHIKPGYPSYENVVAELVKQQGDKVHIGVTVGGSWNDPYLAWVSFSQFAELQEKCIKKF